MAEMLLGVPIEVDGQEIIIIRDSIGTDALAATSENEIFTEIEPRGADGRPAIYIDENELHKLRDSYPGITVYGLWQILFANNLVTLGLSEVVVLQSDPSSGQYLRMAPQSDWSDPANILKSSEYFDNHIPDDYDDELAKATLIKVDVGSLHLPSSPAFTRIELYEKQKHEHTKRWYVAASICIVMAAAFGVYNYTMQTVYKINMAEYESKKAQARDLEQRTAELLKERLLVIPDDSATISRISQVIAYDPLMRSPTLTGQQNSFTSGHVFITRPNFPIDLARKVEGVTSQLTANLEYQLNVSPVLKGVGY
ncbi:hypothetical protein [Pseudomonas baetica]|jgi:hypothetical protein|uniref:hypothetical protein n=1 Tax=Pseudomonas baetica TaxID=674054 RepID=UPI0024074B98|nr:hypothetical protein [Pseudomonas baetica]MDF9779213.1 hypothetical protein [Pseudomonas baetica]